jgi:hypothetical protein
VVSKTADEILDAIAHYCQRINDSEYYIVPIPHDEPTVTASRASVTVRSPHVTRARSGLP